jgi:hypothetical protein
MKIGKPKRTYTIDPIKDPVPRAPVEEPAGEPEKQRPQRHA